MKTIWTKGLEEDEVEEIGLHFNSSKVLRDRLSHIVNEKIDAKEREVMSAQEYEKSNWAFKQADSVGYKRAMKEILSLIS